MKWKTVKLLWDLAPVAIFILGAFVFGIFYSWFPFLLIMGIVLILGIIAGASAISSHINTRAIEEQRQEFSREWHSRVEEGKDDK